MARIFLRLNRIPESEATCKDALDRGFSPTTIRLLLFTLGAMRSDEALMKQQMTSLFGRPDEYLADAWDADLASYSGRLAKAKDLYRRAASLADQRNFKERAASYFLAALATDVSAGNCQQIFNYTDKALSMSRFRYAVISSADLLSRCGKADKAELLMEELQKQYPRDTAINEIRLPIVQASIEFERRNFRKAIDLLQPVIRYERAGVFSVWRLHEHAIAFRAMTLRGRAYLGLGDGKAAIAEFEKVLNNRGLDPLSIDYPLAHVYLARAAKLVGDPAKSRKAYQDFLALWKDADPGIPILKEAMAEYQKLK
jgi:tetratricopeptide (TPR) repeat protein